MGFSAISGGLFAADLTKRNHQQIHAGIGQLQRCAALCIQHGFGDHPVGEVELGKADALRIVRQRNPDRVIADLERAGGIECVGQLRVVFGKSEFVFARVAA